VILTVLILLVLWFAQFVIKGHESAKPYTPKGSNISYDIPDDYVTYRWFRGVGYKMPIGFRNAWMGPIYGFPPQEKSEEALKSNSKSTGYDPATGKYNPKLKTNSDPILDYYNYCLPSMRFSTRHYYNGASGSSRPSRQYGPCGDPEIPASLEDYPVTFRLHWAFIEGSAPDRYAKIIQRQKKLFEGNDKKNLSNWEYNKSGPITGTKPYGVYSDDGDLAVSFWCHKLSSECQGYVLERSSHMAFDIRLPFERIQKDDEELWRDPVQTTIDLIKDWRVD